MFEKDLDVNRYSHVSSPSHANGRRVLISGASIAGPATAYWLDRHGFDVTLVEKAATIRLGGYPIDLRGVAMDVAERMGLRPALLDAHIDSQRATFVDGDGKEIIALDPEWIHGGVPGRDVEVARGELASLLSDLTLNRVRRRFNNSIAALEDDGAGVDVTFDDGSRERFDIVIGADGVHSNTRALTFGDEVQFSKPIGFCFAGFSIPNALGLDREALISNVPGRMVAIYAAGSCPEKVFVLMAFAHPYRLGREGRDPAFQRGLTAKAFAGASWQVPELLRAMETADDLYFDHVEQIRMPAWTLGRVALVGDAAYAPSFLTGQGSSLALTGAYVLASELARHPDHRGAFAAYERKLRPFIALNQATVAEGMVGMIPATAEQLEQRSLGLKEVAGTSALDGDTARPEHSALDLSEYRDDPSNGYRSRRGAAW
jgi:2-polyprenyl-6-methoxyphenol hydroxylase-like FAD-dependent oxidoreductase